MEKDDLEYIFSKFWGDFINKIEINLFTHTISIWIAENKDDVSNNERCIEFREVTAFFFVNDSEDRRLRIKNWEKVEISEMHFLKDDHDLLIYKQEKPNMPNYLANVDFYIEMWNSLLLIEAKAVDINGSLYQIK